MTAAPQPRLDSRHKSAAQGIRAGFLLVMALIVLLGLIGIFYMRSVNTEIRTIIEVHNRKTQLSYDMYIAARERAMQLQAIIDEADPFARDALVPQFHEKAGIFRKAREEMLTLELSHEEYKLLKLQADTTTRGAALQDEVLDLTLSDNMAQARSLLRRQAIPVQNEALEYLRQLTQLQLVHNEQASLNVQGRFRFAIGLMLVSGALVLILTGLIARHVSRRQTHLMAAIMVKEREQQRMNRLLTQANQELQFQKTALDKHAIVSIADTAGNITYVNDKFCAISQFGRNEIMGRNHRVLKSGLHPPEFYKDLWRTIASGKTWSGEICNRRKDGSLYWVDSTIVPFLGNDGLPYQYVSIRTDITERKHLEDSLIDANRDLQTRVDERTQALSQAMRQLEQDIAERREAERTLQRQYQELQSLHRQLQDTQTQLLQSEKMASIGQLAAGVAHEINNPIGYVQSNLGTLDNYIQDMFRIVQACEAARATFDEASPACIDLDALMRELDLPYLKEDMPALMSESKEGIARVRKIVQDLKDFSRLDSSQDWQFADLEKGLESTLNIAHNEIKYKADVVKEYAGIPSIECLPSQLNQVFMNLMVNAAQAIDDKRGTITLRTGRLGDKEIFVEVADTGKGIPEEVRHKIFDPFFTTKPVGQGTGLGLSLAYGIVKKHHGRFEVESEIGRGTTFRIVLPLSQAQSEPDPLPEET